MSHTETDQRTYEALSNTMGMASLDWQYAVSTWNTLPKIKQQIRTIFSMASLSLPGELDLFSESSKTHKSLKFGYSTAVIYLHPHTSSGIPGVNLCRHSTKECRGACLVESGRMRMKAGIQARTWKTHLYTMSPNLYRLMAVYEANRLAQRARADALGYKFGVRMDGTSDTGELINLMPVFRALGIHAWDYTKDFERAWQYLHLFTYSFSGTEASRRNAIQALNGLGNVSVVFRIGRNERLPKKWEGFKVIDGDEHDLRFLDPPGVVVGLRLKGTNNSKARAGKFAVKV